MFRNILWISCLIISTFNSGYVDSGGSSPIGGDTYWFHADANVFSVDYVLPLNMSSNTDMTLDISIAEDNSFQKVLNVTSDPLPDSTFVDSLGVKRYRYRIFSAEPRLVNITISYQVLILFSSLIDLSDLSALDEVPIEIREKYTPPSPYIESDNSEIADAASLLVRNTGTLQQKVEALFDYVSNNNLFVHNYSVAGIIPDHSQHIRGALWALRNRQGVCFDFAHLFAALLRAVDIPARVSEGILLDGSRGFIVHTWTEAYLPPIGWVPYDPTLNISKGNVHMKILNPIHDAHRRFNYTLHSGTVHPFPFQSHHISEQIHVQKISAKQVVDSISVENQDTIQLVRTISVNNYSFSSSTAIKRKEHKKLNLYPYVYLDTSYNKKPLEVLSVKHTTGFLYFHHHYEKRDVTVTTPLSFILESTTMTISIGSLTIGGLKTNYDFYIVNQTLMFSIFAIITFIVGFIIYKKRKAG